LKKKNQSDLKPRPEVKSGEYFFAMNSEEIYSLIQILVFSKEIFLKMSHNCAIEGDSKAETVYAARSALSEALYSRISAIVSIGEPTSRNLH
jgi:hypothetical protein